MSINVCNDRSMASITSLPSGVTGSSLVLISTVTASSSSTVSFTSGIDSTYKEYIFKYINMHPSGDSSPNDFTADVREIEGKPVAKRGRMPGRVEIPRLDRVI